MTGRLPLTTLLDPLTPEERAEVAAGTARIVADSDRRETLSAQRAAPSRALESDERRAASPRSLEPIRPR